MRRSSLIAPLTCRVQHIPVWISWIVSQICVDCAFGLDSAGMSRLSAEGINSSQETDMQAAAIFVAIFAGILVATCLPLILSGKRWRAAEDRAHTRRIADAKMNARLLRFNL